MGLCGNFTQLYTILLINCEFIYIYKSLNHTKCTSYFFWTSADIILYKRTKLVFLIKGNKARKIHNQVKVRVEIDCKTNDCFEITDALIHKYLAFVRKSANYLHNSNECRNQIHHTLLGFRPWVRSNIFSQHFSSFLSDDSSLMASRYTCKRKSTPCYMEAMSKL